MGKSNERIVKHKAFRYSVEAEDPVRPGEKLLRVRISRRGDKLTDLRESDRLRGDALGAFFTEAELKAAETGEQPVVSEAAPSPPADIILAESDEAAVVAWLAGEGEGGHKPSIPQVISAVESSSDDKVARAEIAAKVANAEQAVPDRDARDSLIKKLDAIIAAGEEE